MRPDEQGHGVGCALMAALEAVAPADGIGEIRTSASWRDHGILWFLDAAGFELGRNQVLECTVHAGRLGSEPGPDVAAPDHRNLARELDYSGTAANDFETLARDRADVHVLVRDDLAGMCRIDRRITGRDRRAYIERLVEEALGELGGAGVAHRARGRRRRRVRHGAHRLWRLRTQRARGGARHDRRRSGLRDHGVGAALVSQLFVNLGGLRIERVETVVGRENFALLGFLYALGFEPGERLGFVKRLG